MDRYSSIDDLSPEFPITTHAHARKRLGFYLTLSSALVEERRTPNTEGISPKPYIRWHGRAGSDEPIQTAGKDRQQPLSCLLGMKQDTSYEDWRRRTWEVVILPFIIRLLLYFPAA